MPHLTGRVVDAGGRRTSIETTVRENTIALTLLSWSYSKLDHLLWAGALEYNE